MKTIHFLFSAAFASILACCSSTPLALDPVGPPPPGATASLREGYLKVYTATETHPDGDNTIYLSAHELSRLHAFKWVPTTSV